MLAPAALGRCPGVPKIGVIDLQATHPFGAVRMVPYDVRGSSGLMPGPAWTERAARDFAVVAFGTGLPFQEDVFA